MAIKISHKDLVLRARHWLEHTHKCNVVLTETNSYSEEIPDAIGWTRMGRQSILIECKVSRQDFLRDRNKPFRNILGIGSYRWYLSLPGIIKPEEIPEKWGLAEVGSYQIRKIKKPELFELEKLQYQKEIGLMFSALQKHHANINRINEFINSLQIIKGSFNNIKNYDISEYDYLPDPDIY